MQSIHFKAGMESNEARKSLDQESVSTSESALKERRILEIDWNAEQDPESPELVQARAHVATGAVLDHIYANLLNIETLVIEIPLCLFKLRHRPYPFPIRTLKKLYVGIGMDRSLNLTFKKAIWVLLFCPCLSETALALDLSMNDFRSMLEFRETIAGRSSVKKLALRIQFVFEDSDRKTWWGLPSEASHNSEGGMGNKKTEAVSLLLMVTNQLQCFELFVNVQRSRPGDHSLVWCNCLSSLSRSFNSLQHLRLFGVPFNGETTPSNCYSNFKTVKLFTLNREGMVGLQAFNNLGLPSSLETIYSPWDMDFTEGSVLCSIIDSRLSSLPNLKELVIPKDAITHDGKPHPHGKSAEYVKSRKLVESNKIFRSNRLKLRKVELSETGKLKRTQALVKIDSSLQCSLYFVSYSLPLPLPVGNASNNEVFMSTFRWLS